MDTLANFDSVFFARRAAAPLYVSVAIMYITCPPSTVYAVFNNFASLEKRIHVWPFSGREGGGTPDWRNSLTHVLGNI
jgi:cephalosporin-C deacetylase